MKTRFSTFDLMCTVTELQRLIGMRVAQVYDIDHKTYIIKLHRSEEKCVLLLESGNRMHTTVFEWPKNVAPSGFSMKMRKHLRNKRLESMKQLGIDRVVDLQFGSGEAAYHIILELYDRGNIILTDCDLTILNVLRPHTEGEEVRFAVREKYPLDRAHQRKVLSQEEVEALLAAAKPGDNIKNILNRNTEYGPAILEHILLGAGFVANCKLGKGFNIPQDIPRLLEAFQVAETLFDRAQKEHSKGYIIQKRDSRPLPDGGEEDIFTNHEFHPMIFQQHTNSPQREFVSFDAAVDEFFSTLESQKIDLKALQQEKEAMKKLDNVRKDHSQRLEVLERTQEVDRRRAELITMNQQLVDHVVMAVRAMVASQASWEDIEESVKSAQAHGDPVASTIHELKLPVNHVALKLSNPYAESSGEENDPGEPPKSLIIDIDLDLTAFANARKYYDQKRNAAKKQQKTIDAQTKAFKSAEKKTKQTLKEVQAITHINKARKVFWFEKFHWFISSENYLVIGGRDPQQNELIVKRYLRPGDVYVHADIQGASSIVIKNPSGLPVPPKTLNEAGVMAMSYSVAWDAKVVTSAWWVHHDQVSKTAPTGEYLTTGAFMIRGKKNYLPPSHLIMGFSFLFKLEDSSIERHKDERRVKTLEEDAISSISSTLENASLSEQEQDVEIELEDSDEEGEHDDGDEEKHNEEEPDLVENEENSKSKSAESNSSEEDSPGRSRDHSPEKAEKLVNEDGPNVSGDVDDEESADKEEKLVEFPDVELKIQHTGTIVKLEVPTSPLLLPKDEPQEDQVIFLGDDKPVILKSNATRSQRSRFNREGKKETRAQSETFHAENEMNEKNKGKQQKQEQQQQQQPQFKRGQKGKLKKMKEKYKDQDEEDRKLMMEILKSDGTSRDSKDKGKKKGKDQNLKGGQKLLRERKPRPPQAPKAPAPGEAGEDSDGAEEDRVPAAEVDMLDSLTGQPVTEDELLFTVPVVAPYSTLQSYKFKVKLTPGTGKRGKAAKTAMNIFLKDRGTTPRERDLIKSVKIEDLARNLPGKVKVSAPQLQKLKR